MKTTFAFLALSLVLQSSVHARQRTPSAAGEARPAAPGLAAARLDVADCDGDGRRDLAVLSPDGVLKLFRNVGDGRFEDETALAGLAGVDGASFVLWQDFDGDRRSDLLVGAQRGPRRLFRNLGDGTFEDVAAELGLERADGDRSASWLDADGDGRLDLFVEGRGGARLHRALADGTFEAQVLAPAATGSGPVGDALPPSEPEDRSGDASASDGTSSASSPTGQTSTSTSTLGLPTPGRPERAGTAGGGRELHLGCAAWIEDALHPGSCLQASSVPMPGMLFPPPHDGGVDNVADGLDAFLGGGRNNRTSGDMPTISGGRANVATANYATIGGGWRNEALGDSATVAGGRENIASSDHATASGGFRNEATSSHATIAGGFGNAASGSGASVGGGERNTAGGEHATISGGQYNTASTHASVGGGVQNLAGPKCTVAGGEGNTAYSEGATVGGGSANYAFEPYSTVAGGQSNVAYLAFTTVGGGAENEAHASYSVVGGGRDNVASEFATIPGGEGNRALGHHSFAAGYKAQASHAGAFVWSDTRDFGVKSSFAPDSFSVQARGGSRFYANLPTPSFEITANGASRFLTTGTYGEQQLAFEIAAGGSARFFKTDSPTPTMVVDRTGRVGIGVASPSDALQVRGSLAVDLNERIGWYPSGDTFGFNGRTMGHYTLGWFNDPWDGDGATAWLSGYCGVRLFAGGAPRVNVNRFGNVGINTSAPQFTLEVNGSAGKPGGGAWSVSSDARLKKDVRPLEGALATLLALRGVSYEYKDPEAIHELPGRRLGFLAQEVEQVLPDWVEEGDNGFKRLTIRGFEALAVEALRELETERDVLAAENVALAERVEGLETRLARLEEALARRDTAR